jgi:hypothetical protein
MRGLVRSYVTLSITVDVSSDPAWSERVDMGSDTNVSEAHAASLLKVEVSSVGLVLCKVNGERCRGF